MGNVYGYVRVSSIDQNEDRQLVVMDEKMDLYKEWTRLLRVFQKSSVLTAEILDAFVEKVTVDVDKHIFVEYSFKD